MPHHLLFRGWTKAMLLGASGLAAAAEPPVDADAPWVYQVVPGDTLIGIRDRLLQPGADWRVLQRLNRVHNPRRLQPGQPLQIPLALLREQALAAEVLHVHGEVSLQRGGAAAQRLAGGESLAVGDLLRSGPQASATLRFADGSRLLLRPGSQLRIERLVRLGESPVTDTRLRLDSGAADAQVPPRQAPRFEIRTPVANLGVRGTDFRTRSSDSQATLEVLQGRVLATATQAPPASRSAETTAAGFGTQISAAGVAPPRPLPAAPLLAGLPERVERLPLRLAWPAAADAAASGARYRAQLFEAAAPGRLLLDGVFDAQGARWADDLPDGRYRLQVRSIDAGGLEGHDSSALFTLKARPEPPFTTRPRAAERTADETLQFAWTAQTAAARYRLQVADSADFAQLRFDRSDIGDTTLQLALPLGTHHWRLASIRADGDTGPWGDSQTVTRVALPAAPDSQPPQLGDDGVLLRWRAEPGQRYQLQLAADSSFATPLQDLQLDRAEWLLASPAPGRYFVRVRSIDADGFVGPYGAVQQIEVPRALPWWLLLPAALLLLL